MAGRDEMNNIVAKVFACGIPFNVVWSLYCQGKRVFKEALGGYKGPNYEKVCTTLIQKERLIVERVLELVHTK
jgi:hypothetical protein